jgi:hypothetical protein
MADIRHYLNGQDFGEPRNWQDLEITIDWLNAKESGTINVSDLKFVDKANEYLQKRIYDGLTGGVGIFEGDPYEIAVGDPANPTFVFEGFLDFTQEMTVLGGEEIICALKKKHGEDWLNDVADGFSMAFLYDQGVIVNGDFVKVPYVINYVPDGMQIIVLSMSIYMMTKELIENVERLAETIADVTNSVTPVIGVGVGFGAVAVTAWDLGDFISVVLKALARLAYIIAMTIAIVNLIKEIFEQLLPKKRNHLGMTFRRMYERSCQHLGLGFHSDIAELDWVHIPRKDKKGGSNGENGFPSNSEPIYTFGDLIRVTKEMFNADFRIVNGTFYFQRKDKFIFPSPYQMPSFFNDQERILDGVKFNTNEMVSNYNIYWALDIQDQNTLDIVDGRVFQAITSPINTINKEFVMIKNLSEIAIPFSLGREKTDLTTVEKILKQLAKVVDGLTGVFGRGTSFEAQIENRIGSLLLSSHFLTSGKVVKMSGTKLANNQRVELDAKVLWDKFHFINSFAEYQGIHNQFFRYEKQPVPMTIKDFAILMDNNNAVDANGQEYFVEKVVYNPFRTTAEIDYRVRKKYTNNLQIKIV